MKFPEAQVPSIYSIMKDLSKETGMLDFLHASKIVPKKCHYVLCSSSHKTDAGGQTAVISS